MPTDASMETSPPLCVQPNRRHDPYDNLAVPFLPAGSAGAGRTDPRTPAFRSPSMTEREIFVAALRQPGPDQRRAFLDQACAGDAGLRARVEALLAANDGLGSFLD